MYDRSGDGTGSSKVKIRTNTAKFTNMIIARFRESRYLVRESEVFIKDKTCVFVYSSVYSSVVLVYSSVRRSHSSVTPKRFKYLNS